MKLENIQIKNFRLLQDVTLDFEDDLSLVIGKNNTGKTSILSILEKFLKSENNKFSFDDFSLSVQKCYCELLADTTKEANLGELSIKLLLIIDYSSDVDNLSNIPILNLDHTQNKVIIEFTYQLSKEKLIALRKNFNEENILEYSTTEYLHKVHKSFFASSIRAIDSADESIEAKLESNDIKRIINFQTISAKRGVANDEKEGEKNKKILSKLSHKYFEKSEDPGKNNKIDLQKQLRKTDKELNNIYGKTFESVIKSVSEFGYAQSKITIKSVLEAVNLMRDNTSVVYSESENELPEEYNGLGYLNLFAIIFQLHIICDDFKREYEVTDAYPADINLLFIEEPEAHTHPQMQYVFINNIKKFLTREKGSLKNLQTVVTTHSAHITSQSKFEDIKYLHREDLTVIAKNLSELKTYYKGEDNIYRFIKQYLTLHRSELFFADKIIFVEGDTERILLPAMMKKIDDENKSDGTYTPLLSQNMSIIEVGNYAYLFREFLDFIGVRTIVITDIDSVKKNTANKYVKCPVVEGEKTSNSTLNSFFTGTNFNNLKTLSQDKSIFAKVEDAWKVDNEGQLFITYQKQEGTYHARTFEDAFFSLNLKLIAEKKDTFEGLKNKDNITNTSTNFYELADSCIDSKATFATDILLHSDESYSNWKIPQYIKDGLSWLNK